MGTLSLRQMKTDMRFFLISVFYCFLTCVKAFLYSVVFVAESVGNYSALFSSEASEDSSVFLFLNVLRLGVREAL